MTAPRKRHAPGPQLVALTWLDHQEPGGPNVWWTAEQLAAAEPAVIRSVGWIIREDDTVIVTVTQLADDGTTGAPMVIVKSCITERKALT